MRADPDRPTTAELTGHVIVCGLHGVGVRVVELLRRAGVTAVVVDHAPDPRLVRLVHTWEVPHLVGDSRDASTLGEAGLAGAAAVVCVEADDLHTLETALRARELRPDLRVVVQLANPAVGRAIAEVTGEGSVLDVAELAAPSVVEACLHDPAHELLLGGEPYVVAHVRAPRAGTLRDVLGDLVPVGILGRDGPGEPEEAEAGVCPGRDERVSAGERVVVLGTPSELDGAGLSWRPQEPHRSAAVRPVRPGRSWPGGRRPENAPVDLVRSLAGTIAGAVDRRLRTALGVLVGLVTLSTTLLATCYRDDRGGMGVVDALYFTVETIGTVGYGDFSFRDQPTWLRLFAVALMIFGAMLATVFFALLTNLLVSRRIEEELGRRRVPGMSGHAVVIGVGSIGVRVVEGLLRQGREVVVVERDEGNRYLAQVRDLGVPVVMGDATLPATLQSANVSAAGAVAVLTSDDLTNLEAGLAVRDLLGARWSDVPVVLRLFDRRLARTVESGFAFRHVRSTAALAAPWFVGAALGLDVLATFYVGDRPLLLGRLPVAPGSGLDGLTMRDLDAAIRVVAVARAGSDHLDHLPRRATQLHGGDAVYLVGPYEELLAVLGRDVSPAPLRTGAPG